MKWWLAVALAGIASAAAAADWRDDFHPTKPGTFPTSRPQTAKYRFGWGALSAAEAEIELTRQKKNLLQLKLTAKTIGPVRALYQLDAEHTSICNSTTLRPISLQQIERYRKEVEKTNVDFSDQEVARLAESFPAGKTPPRVKHFQFPAADDLQTALLLVRSQALSVGDRYSTIVYPARAAYLAQIEVVAKEPLKVGGQTYRATKLKISLKAINKKFELEPHEKFKRANAWLSDDENRLLLKVEAEIFVGSVWMELQTIKFLDDGTQRTQMPR